MSNISIKVKTATVIDPETKKEIKVMKITDFCRCVNKSNQQINKLLYEGNRIRKLKYIDIAGTKFIPVEEVTSFPFTASGRGDGFYTYDENGNEVEGTDGAN